MQLALSSLEKSWVPVASQMDDTVELVSVALAAILLAVFIQWRFDPVRTTLVLSSLLVDDNPGAALLHPQHRSIVALALVYRRVPVFLSRPRGTAGGLRESESSPPIDA